MRNDGVKESIIVVAGMHRSGTSLIASLLESAGVDLGQRLIGVNIGNAKGHFENLDFVEFHQKVLRSQGISDRGWTLQEEIEVEEQYVDIAKEVIAKNSLKPLWGWKDPRTTLFLEFWANLLPEANFLLLYRSPWEVVDSLYRRGDEIFIDHPTLAVKMWMHYNQKVVDFYDKFSERCLLINVENTIHNLQTFIKLIEARFKITLDVPDLNLYEHSLFNTQVSATHKPTVVFSCFPEVIEIYQNLIDRELHVDEPPRVPCLEPISAFPHKAWFFQDWVNVYVLNRQNESLQLELERSHSQLQHTQAELQQSQSQLQHTQAELQQSQFQLQHTHAELQQSQFQLQHTQAELQQSQSQLQHTQAELQQSQSQLQHTHAELEISRATILAMETSKFWKLRTWWFKLKRFVGLSFKKYLKI